MSFFKKIFGKKKSNSENTSGITGTVEIRSKKLISKGTYVQNDAIIHIEKIEMAQLIVWADGTSFLILTDDTDNHYISTQYNGFNQAYQQLSSKFGFNDDLFFKTIDKKEDKRVKLWQKVNQLHKPTYTILNTSNNDFKQGFELQTPDKQFVSWDTPYKEIINNPYFKKALDSSVVKSTCAVRIGNIVVDTLLFEANKQREDIAVITYYTQCYHKLNEDESFTDIKNQLALYNNDIEIDEQKNQKGVTISLNSLIFRATFWLESAYTYFEISNTKEYPNLLIDKSYESILETSKFIVFDEDLGMLRNYKQNPRIKRRPSRLTEKLGENPVIWVDDTNNKIGFADKEHSQIFDKNEIKYFRIYNHYPSKTGQYTDFIIVLKNKKHSKIFTAPCHYFDEFAEKITQITEKECSFEGIENAKKEEHIIIRTEQGFEIYFKNFTLFKALQLCDSTDEIIIKQVVNNRWTGGVYHSQSIVADRIEFVKKHKEQNIKGEIEEENTSIVNKGRYVLKNNGDCIFIMHTKSLAEEVVKKAGKII